MRGPDRAFVPRQGAVLWEQAAFVPHTCTGRGVVPRPCAGSRASTWSPSPPLAGLLLRKKARSDRRGRDQPDGDVTKWIGGRDYVDCGDVTRQIGGQD
eukprot:3671610-Rhodomonas_salina.1